MFLMMLYNNFCLFQIEDMNGMNVDLNKILSESIEYSMTFKKKN